MQGPSFSDLDERSGDPAYTNSALEDHKTHSHGHHHGSSRPLFGNYIVFVVRISVEGGSVLEIFCRRKVTTLYIDYRPGKIFLEAATNNFGSAAQSYLMYSLKTGCSVD